MKTYKTFLTDRFFLAYGALQLLGIMSMVFAPFLIAYAALTVLMILLVLSDKRSLVHKNSLNLSIQISATPFLGSQISLDVEVHPQDEKFSHIGALWILVPPLDLFQLEKASVRISGSALKASVIGHSFKAQVYRLGYKVLQQWPVTIESKLGFWKRSTDIDVPELEFRVFPERKEVSEQTFLEMLSQQRLLLQGARIQTRGRSPDQFYSVRKYQYPDSIRHIDQKKTAKYGELMTKLFDTYFSHHLILALDMGRTMRGDVAGSSRHDYYISACWQLANNAIRSRDRVSLFSFSQKTHHIISRTKTLAPFRSLFRADNPFLPKEEETNFQLVAQNINRLSGQRSLVFLFTDLSKPSVQEALLEHLPTICHQHLVVVVSLTDKEHAIEERVMLYEPTTATLKEFTQEYSSFVYDYWLNEKLKVFQRKFSSAGGASLTISHDNWLTSVERLYSLLRSSLYA